MRPPRRKEKLTREEREQIRRERNRVHAKHAGPPKLMLEESENIIACMLEENQRMRTYLLRDCVTLPDDLVYDLDAVSSSEDTDKDDKSGGDSRIGASTSAPPWTCRLRRRPTAIANPAVQCRTGTSAGTRPRACWQPGTLYPSVANKTMFAHQAIFPSATRPRAAGPSATSARAAETTAA